MDIQVVHHQRYLFPLIDIPQLPEKPGEIILSDGFIMQLKELEATSLADSCYYSRVASTHGFVGNINI